MAEIKKTILKITALDELTHKSTWIHQLLPTVKLITTVIYLITVISFGPNQISGLLPYFIYPVLLMSIGEIPVKQLLQRLLIAMPFALFAGISNLIFSRNTMLVLGTISITGGMISFCSIIIKTLLTVTAVLILIATTGMNDLLYAMLQLRLPSILVLQIMMTFRYIGVLAEEVSVMFHAYILRAPKEKGIKLKDMGTFLGQLIIRSFDRAERIYQAMKCRGFEGGLIFSRKEKINKSGWFYIVIVGGLMIILRFVNVSELIGRLIV